MLLGMLLFFGVVVVVFVRRSSSSRCCCRRRLRRGYRTNILKNITYLHTYSDRYVYQNGRWIERKQHLRLINILYNCQTACLNVIRVYMTHIKQAFKDKVLLQALQKLC